MCADACGHLKKPQRAKDPLKLQFQVVENCLVWTLGTESRFLGRAICLLNTSHLSSPTAWVVNVSISSAINSNPRKPDSQRPHNTKCLVSKTRSHLQSMISNGCHSSRCYQTLQPSAKPQEGLESEQRLNSKRKHSGDTVRKWLTDAVAFLDKYPQPIFWKQSHRTNHKAPPLFSKMSLFGSTG